MVVYLIGRRGPLAGQRIRVSLDHPVRIGRAPGPGGVELEGDQFVGRIHGELAVERGRVVYKNQSDNGTIVDGEIERGTRVLAHGASLRFGSEHELVLQMRLPEGPVQSQGSSGALSNPLVKVGIAVYLIAIVGLGIYLSRSDEDRTLVQWEAVRTEYVQTYQLDGLSEEEKTRRLERADQLFREIQAYERTGRIREVRRACQELMALDENHDSPLYRFAARRLGRLRS